MVMVRMFFVFFILAGVNSWSILSYQVLRKKETEQLMKINQRGYIKYIVSLSKQWYWYQTLGTFGQVGARVVHTKEELYYADAAGPFFDNFDSKTRMEKMAGGLGSQQNDIDYMYDLINDYKRQGAIKKDLSRILHKKNLENLSLSANITPKKLASLVKKGQVNMQRYYRNVGLNIFLRYLVEKKLLP